MSMDSLNMITDDKLGTIGLEEILKLVREALENKKPIYIKDESKNKVYQLTENSKLIELK